MKKVILIILILQQISSQCATGCLKCNSSDTCLVCNTLQGVYLTGGVCKASTQTNCSNIAQSGNCYVCASLFYVDPNSFRCVAVTTASTITNCASYGTSGTCSSCLPNFYLSNAACVAVTTAVPNCKAYSSATLCSICSSGFLLSLDYLSCTNRSSDNCLKYSTVNCSSCVTGYYFNENFGSSAFLNTLLNVQNTIDLGNTLSFLPKNVCQQIAAKNCATYVNFQSCLTCLTGYYLSSGACILFPVQGIAGCMTYTSNIICSNCNQGYFLASSNQCTAITAVKNCSTYDGAASTTSCITCLTGFYVSASTTCTARVNSLTISGCATPSANNDVCSVCQTGLILTTDSLACLTAVANCSTYATSSKSSTSLTCTSCVTLYYLNASSVCTLGTVTNCSVYQTSANTCLTCQNTFYLNNALCVAHNPIINCTAFSPTVANTCTTCANNTILFSLTNTCVSVTTSINGCQSYTSQTVCSSCNVGYYLSSSGNTCTLIPTNLNCLTYNGTGCTACNSGYFLSNSLCYLPFDFQTLNCVKTSMSYNGTEGFGLSKCSSCNTNSYDHNFSASGVCFQVTQLQALATASQTLSVTLNCVKHKLISSGLQCQLCDTGFFLDINFACVSTCPTTYIPVLNYFNSGINPDHKMKFCVLQSSYPGCSIGVASTSIAATAGSTFSDIICVACATNFVLSTILPATTTVGTGVQNPLSTSYNYFLGTSIDSTTVPSQITQYPPVNCVTAPSNAIASCLTYPVASATFCLRCLNTFAPTVTTVALVATPDNQKGVLGNTCAQIANCSGYGEGLDLDWAILVSCTQCSSNSVVVDSQWIISNNRAVPKFLQIGSSTTPGYYYTQPPTAGSLINCKTPPTAVSNCQVYAEQSLGTTTIATTSICIACQPGYSISMANSLNSCTIIQNCSTATNGSLWLNYCSACASGFVFSYSSGIINFAMCTTNALANCYAASGSTSCSICNVGYNVNIAGLCEQITPPNCTSNVVLPQIGISQTVSSQKSTALYMYQTGVGCNKCNSGYISIVNAFTSTTVPICVPSPYQTSTTSSPLTPFIANCSQYTRQNSNQTTATPPNYYYGLLCSVCSSNFIPASNQLSCISSTGIANCQIGLNSSSSNCTICNVGYSLVNNACVLQNISNCITYSTTSGLTTLTCSACADSYYLSNNICVAGTITNCINYSTSTSPISCIMCATGYSLLVNKNGIGYCIQNDPTLNCATYNSQNLGNLILACTKCLGNRYISTLSADLTINSFCLKLSAVTNCLTYDIKNTISASSYSCTSCITGFFLNSSNLCVTRTVLPANCNTYTSNADTCSGCSGSFFLASNSLSCLPYPAGLFQCSIYSNLTTCTTCNNGYYLLNNVCTAVTTAISNCVQYKDNLTCILCGTGFVAVNGNCTAATATNCVTYTSVSVCATCSSGYGLQTTNGVTNCVAYTDTNCLVATASAPFTCTTCNSGYYPNTSGLCVAVAATITNCKTYDSTSTCSMCNTATALSVDRKTCDGTTATAALYDPNCMMASIVSTPICSVCQPGLFLQSGACKNCTITGCFACDPQNQTSCLVCSSNYFMNSNFSCVQTATNVNTTNTTNTTNQTTPKYVELMKAIIGFSLILIYVL